jgi:hypothetical protein
MIKPPRKPTKLPAPPPQQNQPDPSGQISVISLDDLVQDPANLRVHPEQNKKVIRGSVRRFGPARSIVIDQGGVIIAGNETANACAAEGLKEVLVVDPKPGQLVAVRRSDWSEGEKTGYGIADNKTSDGVVWAPEIGDALDSLKLDGFDLECLGFSDAELGKLLADDRDEQSVPTDRVSGEPELCSCPKCGHTFPK